jgi:hypothetical protein
MLQTSAAHFPVCVTYLQLAACESDTGLNVCTLGDQNSNWNTVEHVWVAKSQRTYVARF